MAVIGDTVQIHSYKHDKSLHRIWDEALFLDETAQYVVFVNDRTRVLESNGKSWFTKEPAVCFFFKNQWYNVISMIKDTGVHYYCNLGSPYTIDDEAVKYVDYDLDIKVFPNKQYKVLDKFEYQVNAERMNYPEDIKQIIRYEMIGLKKRIKTEDFPFDEEIVMKYYNLYKEMLGNERS